MITVSQFFVNDLAKWILMRCDDIKCWKHLVDSRWNHVLELYLKIVPFLQFCDQNHFSSHLRDCVMNPLSSTKRLQVLFIVQIKFPVSTWPFQAINKAACLTCVDLVITDCVAVKSYSLKGQFTWKHIC